MSHRCHARGCKEQVPPRMLMCKRHWYMVPRHIRRRVWAYYREGQCDDKRPSRMWLEAADDAIKAVWEKEQAKLRGRVNNNSCEEASGEIRS